MWLRLSLSATITPPPQQSMPARRVLPKSSSSDTVSGITRNSSLRQRASGRSDQIAKMKALSVLCFAFWVLFLFGCSPKESDVKGDLTQYMDKARLWAATEAQINNAIASVRRDQFVHDDFVA